MSDTGSDGGAVGSVDPKSVQVDVLGEIDQLVQALQVIRWLGELAVDLGGSFDWRFSNSVGSISLVT